MNSFNCCFYNTVFIKIFYTSEYFDGFVELAEHLERDLILLLLVQGVQGHLANLLLSMRGCCAAQAKFRGRGFAHQGLIERLQLALALIGHNSTALDLINHLLV